jgi:hypothetical protein
VPRLNYGTLLENIVVLESTRLCLAHMDADMSLGFATSFAMPPLTQCWCKPSDEQSSPRFRHDFLLSLSEAQSQPGSLQEMWALCLDNAPRLPVWCYREREGLHLYASGGPNGALLASMLTSQGGREIALWSNDDGGRYAPPSAADRTVPDTVQAASELAGAKANCTTTNVADSFPHTISRLQDWLEQGAGRSTKVRIGFLDPDNYAEGKTQVSPQDHRHWLRVLATGADMVLSVMFSGCQNMGRESEARNRRLALFHNDEAEAYPESLVFEHGGFQTGVKIRWPGDAIDAVAAILRQRVEDAWLVWHTSMRPLTVHRNGQPST